MSNIYTKLQAMRVALQNMNLKKSGENKFAGYKYYELGDFLPSINQLMAEHGVCSIVSYGDEQAVLTLFNSDKPDEKVSFCSPMKDATLKGAHPIQNLGAVETYQRRYLYMTAFEIVESDALDATQGRDSNSGYPSPPPQQKKAYKPAERPTQPKKQNTSLPDDLSAQLNQAIKDTKAMTGLEVKVIVGTLESDYGLKMSEVTVDNAQAVFDALSEIQGAQLPF